MGEVLVLVEQSDGSVKKVTSELLTLARRLGEPSAVWVGPGVSDAAVATLGEFGATTVYVAGDEALAAHPVAPKAEVLAQLVAEKAPTAVLIASTADGKEAAGRLAVRTESGVITDAVDIDACPHRDAVGLRRLDRRATPGSPAARRSSRSAATRSHPRQHPRRRAASTSPSPCPMPPRRPPSPVARSRRRAGVRS